MDMQTKLDAGALVIRNLGVIERAHDMLWGELSDLVLSRLEKALQTELEEKQPNWPLSLPMAASGKYSEEDSYFGDESWCIDIERDSWLGQFDCWRPYVDSDLTSLTLLCGLGETRVGIVWRAELSLILPPTLRGKARMSKWLNFAKEQDDKHMAVFRESGSDQGFSLRAVEGDWFLPIGVSASELADAYLEQDIERVLKPVAQECIARVARSAPAFSEILEAAKQYDWEGSASKS